VEQADSVFVVVIIPLTTTLRTEAAQHPLLTRVDTVRISVFCPHLQHSHTDSDAH
jgi:hypothetical protein